GLMVEIDRPPGGRKNELNNLYKRVWSMHKKAEDDEKEKKIIIVPVGMKLRPNVWKYIFPLFQSTSLSQYNSLDSFLFV
ncbi:hypothetical protein PV327_005886, partial [Microctonus hyperodae]